MQQQWWRCSTRASVNVTVATGAVEGESQQKCGGGRDRPRSDTSEGSCEVNEEIEANIQKTVYIESEIVRCCEVEKSYIMKESELMKMVFAGEFELNGLTEVGATMRRSLSQMEEELTLVRLDRENMEKRLCEKREKFIMECKQFQEDIAKEENTEFLELLSEKEALENEKKKLVLKINALKNSTSEFIEDVLGDIHNSTSALQVASQHTSLENKKVLKDIHELKGLLLKLT